VSYATEIDCIRYDATTVDTTSLQEKIGRIDGVEAARVVSGVAGSKKSMFWHGKTSRPSNL